MVKLRRWKPEAINGSKEFAARLLCHGTIGVVDKLTRVMGYDKVHLSYSGPFWTEISKQIKIRDYHRCRSCGSARTLDCHHVVKIKDGGTNLSGNLKTLCRKCHKVRHPEVRKDKYVS